MDWLRAIPIVSRIFNYWRSRVGLDRKRDAATFQKLDIIANETCIKMTLNSRIYTSDLRYEDLDVLKNFIEALNRIENRYLDFTLQLRAEQLAWAMGQLLDVVHRTFFEGKTGRLRFYPEPIAQDIFQSEWEDLLKKLEDAWEAYQVYRLTVKERLRL